MNSISYKNDNGAKASVEKPGNGCSITFSSNEDMERCLKSMGYKQEAKTTRATITIDVDVTDNSNDTLHSLAELCSAALQDDERVENVSDFNGISVDPTLEDRWNAIREFSGKEVRWGAIVRSRGGNEIFRVDESALNMAIGEEVFRGIYMGAKIRMKSAYIEFYEVIGGEWNLIHTRRY